jgi:hypothetical protein
LRIIDKQTLSLEPRDATSGRLTQLVWRREVGARKELGRQR